MARLTCPPWVGFLLLNPVRKLFENPYKILGRFVREGMIVLEPGCGMGYFTFQASFFAEIWQALKPGGTLLFFEPTGHVSKDQFEQSIDCAKKTGFRPEALSRKLGVREVLLTKPPI